MKTVRYLVPVLGVALICAVAVFAVDKKKPSLGEISIPAGDMRCDVHPATLPISKARQILDANPKLVHWLLEQSVTKGDVECHSADNALSALAPIAAVELLEEVDNQNTEVRKLAMDLLARGATSPTFPHKEVVARLLKIAQDEKEGESMRQHATKAICEIICAIQCVYFPQPTA